jgi:hypothetical protein
MNCRRPRIGDARDVPGLTRRELTEAGAARACHALNLVAPRGPGLTSRLARLTLKERETRATAASIITPSRMPVLVIRLRRFTSFVSSVPDPAAAA